MRLATKNTLAVIALYFVLLGGLALWMDYQLRSMAETLMEGSARLVGGEVAAAMSESALEQLLQADPGARQRLVQMVADLTARSEVVAAIAVVDENGQVVVSDDIEVGKQLALPAVIFQDDRRPQFLSVPTPLGGGRYHLFVPLVRNDNLVGYLRLSMSSERIGKLYRRAQRQLIVAAATGVALAIGIGLLFQTQIARRSAALTRALEGAMRGEEVPRHPAHDDFADALAAARRVGKELSEAREKSSDAQRRFGALMKVMDVGVLLVGSNGLLEFANPTARELLGCRDAGVLETRWAEIWQTLEAAFTHAGEASRVDLDLPSNGRTCAVRVELSPLDDEHPDGRLLLVKNRETMDALENELRLAIQMRGFARFYMAFTHDLKAPLNAMVLNLELLKESLKPRAALTPEQIQDRQGRYIGVLQDELSRLDRYLRMILAQAAPPSESREEFDLRDLLQELATLLSPQAKQQHVALETRVPDQPLPVLGHRDRLKQALLNIAINAIESMPDGGHIGLELRADDGHGRIAVRDDGPGIPPELLSQIYRMHFTTKEGGTGIGLYVARSVVESHGGQIHVESTVGHGTCFEVALPLAGRLT